MAEDVKQRLFGQLASAVYAVGSVVKNVRAQRGPFSPDGVYNAILYRVRPSGSIDAMMPGGMVRFRDMHQFLEAAEGNQQPVAIRIARMAKIFVRGRIPCAGAKIPCSAKIIPCYAKKNPCSIE